MKIKPVALMCATALTITLVVMIMVSDVLLRSQDIPGTDPGMWDAIGSAALGLNSILIAYFLFAKDKGDKDGTGAS